MRIKGTIIVLMISLLFCSGSLQAQWLEGWPYRCPVTVANDCGEELADHQVLVRLDALFNFTETEADGVDIRFTDTDGETLLPFWIDEWEPGTDMAGLWVRIPTLPPAGTTIYLYYGNELATAAADGHSTFDVYEGFETYGSGNPGEWDRYAGNPLITEGPPGAWDDHGATFASVIWDNAEGEFRMYYHGFTSAGAAAHQVGMATSTDGLNWTKYPGNPIVTPGPSAWDNHSVRVPMVWKEGTDYHMIYTGYNGSAFQVGYAYSSDGINWTKHASNPVFNDPTWANNETENWGVMKVGSDYLMWYSDFGVRRSGIAVSSDLLSWTPHTAGPIFGSVVGPSDYRYNQYCPFSFKYGGDYYVLVPSYNNTYNFSRYYLYRSSSPYFPVSDRHLVRIAHEVGAGGQWDDNDSDTPFVLTLDIERTLFYNDELWCYYSAEGGANLWKEGLHLETDIAAALADAPLPGSMGDWTISGDVAVAGSPVHQGAQSMCSHDPTASGGTTLTGTFPSKAQGVVGSWMRRTSTSNGDYDIYLYDNEILSCVAGLGREGDFHYWNGSFQPTGVSWAINTWYLVNIFFNAATDLYDFVVLDQNFAELVRIEDIAFGNQSSNIDKMMFYTSTAYVGDGYTDDVRVRPWCGSDPTTYVGDEETEVVGVLIESYAASFDGSYIEIEWVPNFTLDRSSVEVSRARVPSRAFEHINDPTIEERGRSFIFRDGSVEPGMVYRYRVESEQKDGERLLLLETAGIATHAVPMTLYQNSPNPFNPSTRIEFYLPERGEVTLDIYDVAGNRISRLVDREVRSQGLHSIEWNGRDINGRAVSSGVYFYRLNSGKNGFSKKMVLLR